MNKKEIANRRDRLGDYKPMNEIEYLAEIEESVAGAEYNYVRDNTSGRRAGI